MIRIPVQHVDEMRELLEHVEVVDYSVHFEEDVNPDRDNVSKEKIERHLQNPETLEVVQYERDDHPRDKYLLYFDDSTKYYLKVVVSIADEYLNVVTSHVISKRRIRRMEEYYE